MTRQLLCICLLTLFPALGRAGDESAAAIRFFETNVRPVLANRCFSCHGPDKHKGDLRVDSLAAMLEGGKSGPALKPGYPDESLLIQAIRHSESLQMPPKTKLPAREIADLTAWVKQGAPWPSAKAVAVKAALPPKEMVFTKEQTGHWAFQKIDRQVPPAVKNQAWVKSPLDAFILARLEASDLAPAPAADPRTLVRRVTFDLTGLPPTPAEIEEFVQESAGSPAQRQAALAKVVERLLASPRYGERWARHWLDLVRYADSNGMDENLVFANAWRYRDYVVSAFNADLPYDQFVREQIAGDLLPGNNLVATGFLCFGPKMLAEDDPVKMEMDIIDEQLDTTGRAFLGLTIGCARCHDHKYDPLSTADYYALAGILKSTKTMDNFRVVARWQERPLGAPAELAKIKAHAKEVAGLKERINRNAERHYQQLVQPERLRVQEYLHAARVLQRQGKVTLVSVLARKDATPAGLILIEAEDYQRGNVLKSFTGYGENIGVIYNKGELPNVAEYDITLKEAGTYQLELRYAAAEARPLRLLIGGQVVVTDAAAKSTGSWYPDTQTWFAEGVVQLKAGVNVIRLERDGPFPHIDKLALVPSTMPATAAKTLEQVALERKLNKEFLRQWLEFVDKNAGATDLDKRGLDAKGPFRLSPAVETTFTVDAQAELRVMRKELVELEKKAPPQSEAMAVSEGQATNLRIHLRGNHLTLGSEAPRRFPRIFTPLQSTPIDNTHSGRLQLARWLTQPDHPLTSRVLVNRLWHWHFGTGLVRSVDNFGLLGDKPSHPELLDWLAGQFIDSGWSLKAMHRLIVLSSTYQMSAAYAEAGFRVDPDNRLHWRHTRRRLEVEALRDALYVLGGKLDLTMGGSLFEAKNRQYVPGYPNANYEKYDIPRRSLYMPVIRSALYDVFQAFDFADPSFASGERATTTIAPQALFHMNGKIVHEQTRLWAAQLLGAKDLDDVARITRIYTQALGRPPREPETAGALQYLRRIEAELARLNTAESRARAWESLCRVIVASNEFVYVE